MLQPVTVSARRTSRPRRPDAFRLRGAPRKAALILHVLASVGWFGLAVAIVVCVVAAHATADQAFAHALYRVMAASPWLSVPAGLAAGATGTLVGLGSRYGLIRHWWVVVKTLLTVAVVVTDAFLVTALTRAAAATGEAAPPLYGSTCAHVVVLVIATALSVVKPGGLTPWSRRVVAGGRARRDTPSSRQAVGLRNSVS